MIYQLIQKPGKKHIIQRIIISFAGIIFTFGLYYKGMVTPIIEKTHHLNRSPVTTPKQHWGAKFSNIDYAKVFGVLNFHLSDISKFYEEKIEKPKQLDVEHLTEFNEIVNQINIRNTEPSEFLGIAKEYNIIFLLLESFQHFLIDLTVDGTEVTPFLNQLHKKSFHWNYIYDASFRGRTSDVEFMLNTALYPDIEKVPAFYHVNKEIQTFPGILKQSGYKTFTFHGYKGDFWNRINSHPFYGIDNLYFKDAFPEVKKLGMGVPDKTVFPFAIQTMAKTKSPFYGFIISLSCHHPYNKQPVETEGLFPSVEDKLASGYLKLQHYTDQAIKLMYEELSRYNLLENSIIVIFGDHDCGSFSTRANKSSLQIIFSLWEECCGANPFDIKEDRVFFIIDIPSRRDKIKLFLDHNPDHAGTLIDTFPTVFHLLGLPIPENILGSHLFHDQNRLYFLPPAFDFNEWTRVDRFLTEKELFVVHKNNNYLEIYPVLNRYNEILNKEKLHQQYNESRLIYLTNMAIINGQWRWSPKFGQYVKL